MANLQAQFGFKHIGALPGYAPTYEQSVRPIQKTYTTAIGFGDPVIRQNATSPYIIQATGSLATAGPIEGIFVGCQYIPSGGLGIPQWSPFWPGVTANADAVGYVIDNPGALFLVAALQTAITSGNIGQVVNFTTGAAGTTGAGLSIATVDQSTATSAGSTVSLLPFKIYGIFGAAFGNFALNQPGVLGGVGNGSDPTTNYNWVVVSFNNQINRSPYGY
jgi:hypothetical protein